MELKPIYIPFQNIFPSLVGSLSTPEEFLKSGGRIDPKTPYGQSHKATVALERRIKNLHLIMHRIRLDCGIKILAGDTGQINFLYLPIDFETYFVWLRVIMDQIAYLTPLFYETGKEIPRDSFTVQLKWFTKTNPKFDKKYAEYLEKNMSWFSKMKEVRDDSIHRHYWAYAEVETVGKVKIKRMRGNRPLEEVESLAKTIGEYYIHLSDFSKFYEEHFKEKLLEKNKNLEYRTQSTQMVNEYFASLNYFIQNAKE